MNTRPSPFAQLVALFALCLSLMTPLSGCDDAPPDDAPPPATDAPRRSRQGPRPPLTLNTPDDARHAGLLYARRAVKRRLRWFGRQQGIDMALGIQQGAVQTIDRLFDATREPEVVTYEVKKGGTLEAIANRFKLFHHEIETLNPTLRLRQDLASGASVFVYRRDPALRSQSVGAPSSGTLEHAVPMLEGPGRSIYAARWKAWGTAATIAHIDYVLRQWARNFPSAPIVLVGNLSARKGGHLPPHSSHQSGRDVDVSYISKWDGKSEVSWQKMTAQNLDAALTWELLRLFVATSAVELIFIDYDIQRLLYDHAKARNLFTPEQLAFWLQYPDGPNTRHRIIQHVPGHVDHIHVRFACRSTEPGCVPSPSAPDLEYLASSDITSSPAPLPDAPPTASNTPTSPTSPTSPTTPNSPSASNTPTAHPSDPSLSPSGVMQSPPERPRDPFLALDEDDRLFSP